MVWQIMLRAKQLGTLSQSARFFFLSGSRCAADGSSCTCSEDETCVSGRPQRKNEVPHSQISSTITSKPVGVGSAIPGDAGKVLNCQKPVSINYSVSQPQVIPGCGSLSGSSEECANYSVFDTTSMMHSSPPILGQFVKAGVAAVNFLSDLVNYKIPLTEGSALCGLSQNSVVDHSKSIHVIDQVKPIRTVDCAKSTNARVANAKMARVEKGHPEVHLETAAGSSATKNFSVAKGGVDKPTPVKRDDTGY